jgi:hypothetical protein
MNSTTFSLKRNAILHIHCVSRWLVEFGEIILGQCNSKQLIINFLADKSDDFIVKTLQSPMPNMIVSAA